MSSEDNAAAWQLRAARSQALFRAINEELRIATRPQERGDRGGKTT